MGTVENKENVFLSPPAKSHSNSRTDVKQSNTNSFPIPNSFNSTGLLAKKGKKSSQTFVLPETPLKINNYNSSFGNSPQVTPSKSHVLNGKV